MINDSMYSSNRTDWETPQSLFNEWNTTYNFELDVCALPENAKCERFFSPFENGLIQNWSPHRCWMNPPYGKDIIHWVKKAAEEFHKGATVVALLPARTDTKWFHTYVLPYAKITFLKGRVKFVGATSGAPFPSLIAEYTLNKY